MWEPSVKMKKLSLYLVLRRERKRALPSSGLSALVQGAGRLVEMKEEKGNQWPKGEKRSTGEKGAGVTATVARKERALVMNGVCGW